MIQFMPRMFHSVSIVIVVHFACGSRTRYNCGMSILLPALGVAFAAFCIWLGVRMLNRRDRWAKRTLVGLVLGLPVLYVASFGPACWTASRTRVGRELVGTLYQPLIRCWSDGPRPVSRAIDWWMRLACSSYWEWIKCTDGIFRWFNEAET